MKANIFIEDSACISFTEFWSKAKSLVRSKGVRFIVVDYLQLMQGPPELRGMREQEVAAISRMLKGTAKELNIPIMALSQLSRNSVQRTNSNNRPMLSDLRESGSIEQDADIVLFVHRPDAIGLGDTVEDKEYSGIIIAKDRNGLIDSIPMMLKGEQQRVVENTSGTFESAMNTEAAVQSDYSPFPSGDDFSNSSFQ